MADLKRLEQDVNSIKAELGFIQSKLNNEAKRYPNHPNSAHMTSIAYKMNDSINSARHIASEIKQLRNDATWRQKIVKWLRAKVDRR